MFRNLLYFAIPLLDFVHFRIIEMMEFICGAKHVSRVRSKTISKILVCIMCFAFMMLVGFGKNKNPQSEPLVKKNPEEVTKKAQMATLKSVIKALKESHDAIEIENAIDSLCKRNTKEATNVLIKYGLRAVVFYEGEDKYTKKAWVDNFFVYSEILRFLGLKKEKKAIRCLIEELKQDNITIAEAELIIQTLCEITGLGDWTYIGRQGNIKRFANWYQKNKNQLPHQIMPHKKSRNIPPRIPLLIKIMLDKNEEVNIRRHAIYEISCFADKATIPALLQVIKDRDNAILYEAISALAAPKDTSVLPVLIDVLTDPKLARFKKITGISIIRVFGTTANNAIFHFMRDEDGSLRMGFHNIQYITHILDSESIPKLIKLLSSPDRYVRFVSNWALEIISKEKFGADVAKWREWWEKNKDRILKEEAEKERLEKEKSEEKAKKTNL